MSWYLNSTTKTPTTPRFTTNTPNVTTQGTRNQTLNHTTSILRSSPFTTIPLNYTRNSTIPTENTSRSITYGPKNEGNSNNNRRTLIIGASIAVLLLIVILFVMALIVMKKRRKQRQSTDKNRNEKKDKNIAVESHGDIMKEVKIAIAKKNGVDQEYDDVISPGGDDDQDNDYEYVHVTPSAPQQYNSLGPQDAQNIYEQIAQNGSEDSVSYNGAEYQNCTDGQGAPGRENVELTNQAEVTKDGYLVPVPPPNTGSDDSLYSAAYIKVVP